MAPPAVPYTSSVWSAVYRRHQPPCGTSTADPSAQVSSTVCALYSVYRKQYTVMAAVHWLRVGAIIAEFNVGGYQYAPSR